MKLDYDRMYFYGFHYKITILKLQTEKITCREKYTEARVGVFESLNPG